MGEGAVLVDIDIGISIISSYHDGIVISQVNHIGVTSFLSKGLEESVGLGRGRGKEKCELDENGEHRNKFIY